MTTPTEESTLDVDSVAKATEVYGFREWGEGYFEATADGRLNVREHADGALVGLSDVVEQAKKKGWRAPGILRFKGILHDRINALGGAFVSAMQQFNYRGDYHLVYPVKVNQERRVVEEVINAPLRHAHVNTGLEAGSKSELIAVLALSQKQDAMVVCNGYKDRETIRLALLGMRLGKKVYLVIEKPSELALILDEADSLGVKPLLGVRVKLASIGRGNWQNTGGEKSKFGLSAPQILELIEQLQTRDAIDCLHMLHVHLGSQISNLQDIAQGMKEVSRYFSECHRLGVNIRCIDVGGGLGVDYEGASSRRYFSMNYSIADYAQTVVGAVAEVCDKFRLPNPDIVTESGRAVSAHHAVLIADVIDQDVVLERSDIPEKTSTNALLARMDDVCERLRLSVMVINKENKPNKNGSLMETYHEVLSVFDEIKSHYLLGLIDMPSRARAEQQYFYGLRCISELLNRSKRDEFEALEFIRHQLADKLFVNFSVFQSLPDVWGISQIFPIAPLGKLNTPLNRRAVLQDITCDSDGRIDGYVDSGQIESTLALPSNGVDNDITLGFFLVGAYQEILGDRHNLFGDVDSIDVSISEAGEVVCERLFRGESVSDMISSVHFNADQLIQLLKEQLQALGSEVGSEQKRVFETLLDNALGAYTYLKASRG